MHIRQNNMLIEIYTTVLPSAESNMHLACTLQEGFIKLGTYCSQKKDARNFAKKVLECRITKNELKKFLVFE